jgi:hypothetical protein
MCPRVLHTYKVLSEKVFIYVNYFTDNDMQYH